MGAEEQNEKHVKDRIIQMKSEQVMISAQVDYF